MNFLSEELRPVWADHGTAWCESVAPLENQTGEVWIPLYYHADEILCLQSADRKTIYQAGRDFCLENGGIRLLPGTRIRTISWNEQYPAEKTDHTYAGRNGIPYILYGEGAFFHERQLSVTYHHTDAWRGTLPIQLTEHLPRFHKVLCSPNDFRLMIYGDSIAEGANATERSGVSPFLMPFGELFAANLMHLYDRRIDVINTALGGTTSEWGAQNVEARVAEYEPDFVLLAFGMNDGSGHRSPKDFQQNIQSIIETVRAKRSDTEFLLVSSICANPEACLYGNQEEYPAVLQELCGEGIAFANMTAMHQELLKRKRYMDMTGNNVNHPNDYLHRIYAQILTALIQQK